MLKFFGRAPLMSSTAIAGPRFRGIGAAAAENSSDDDTDAGTKGAEGDDTEEDATAAGGKEVEPKGKTKAKPKGKTKGKPKDNDGDDDGEGDDEGDGEGDEEGDGEDDADGDDDSDEKDMRKGKKNAAVRNARLRERARITQIVQSAGAAVNISAALNIALNTDMGRDRAESLLGTLPANQQGAAATLGSRMAAFDGKHAGQDAPRSSSRATATDAAWDDVASRTAITKRGKSQ